MVFFKHFYTLFFFSCKNILIGIILWIVLYQQVMAGATDGFLPKPVRKHKAYKTTSHHGWFPPAKKLKSVSLSLCEGSLLFQQGSFLNMPIDKLSKVADLRLTQYCRNMDFESGIILANKIESLPHSVERLKLHVGYHDTDTDGARSLIEPFEKFPSLSSFSIEWNYTKAHDQAAEALVGALSGLVYITDLKLKVSLSQNHLMQSSNYQLLSIEPVLGAFCYYMMLHAHRLTRLDLDVSRYDINSASTKALAGVLKEASCLKYLGLNLSWGSGGSGKAEKDLAQALKTLTQLTHLRLNFAGYFILHPMQEDLMQALAALFAVTNMHLDFSYNKLEVERAKALAKVLKNFSYLTHLRINLYGNAIGDEGVQALAEALRELKLLEHLGINVDGNDMTYKGGLILAEAVGSLPKLKYFEHIPAKVP